MEYIWIVIGAIVYIIWAIASIKDFIYTKQIFVLHYVFENLENYTKVFITVNIVALFIASFAKWLGLW